MLWWHITNFIWYAFCLILWCEFSGMLSCGLYCPRTPFGCFSVMLYSFISSKSSFFFFSIPVDIIDIHYNIFVFQPPNPGPETVHITTHCRGVQPPLPAMTWGVTAPPALPACPSWAAWGSASQNSSPGTLS